MHANDWMNTLNVLWACIGIVAVKISVSRFEICLTSIDDLSELRRKLLIRRVTRRPERISADGWDDVVVQMCDGCRLKLMDQICVPADNQYRKGDMSTSSTCHRDAPPGFLKLAVRSVAMRAGQMTETPSTPGT